MITIRPVTCEEDFQVMLHMESAIARDSDPVAYTAHPSQLVFFRYLYGSGGDIFSRGKLLARNGVTIGYALIHPGEPQFSLRLLPTYEGDYTEAILGMEALFPHNSPLTVIANSLYTPFCDALTHCGFTRLREG